MILDVVAKKGIVTAVNDNNVEYHKQGNLQMYTAENMRKREALKVHPDVERNLERMWLDLKKDREGNVSKEVYVEIILILYNLLIPDGNVQQARLTAEVILMLNQI
jgi:hypothetical protein